MEAGRTRIIAGCMTGTSLDGLDVALAEIRGGGLEMSARALAASHRPLGGLGEALRKLASGEPAPPIEYLETARRLGELHAGAVEALCRQAGLPRPDLVGAHGQTIWHAAAKGLSWQLFDPWPLVRRLRTPVVHDLRQADLIAGGEGAPITPLSDWVLYRHAARRRVILNLGGICNLTLLPADCAPEEIRGGDLGPCNLLLDGLVRALFPDLAYDSGGRLAARGTPSELVREILRRRGAPRRDGPGARPRSLGREDYPDGWIAELAAEARRALSPEDALASAVEAVALEIAEGVAPFGAQEVILAGGGARNPVLASRIASHLPGGERVLLSDELGIAVEIREALGIAVLAALSQDGVPITLPPVTGASEPGRAGTWVYP